VTKLVHSLLDGAGAKRCLVSAATEPEKRDYRRAARRVSDAEREVELVGVNIAPCDAEHTAPIELTHGRKAAARRGTDASAIIGTSRQGHWFCKHCAHALALEVDDELHDLTGGWPVHRYHDHRLAVRKRQSSARRLVHCVASYRDQDRRACNTWNKGKLLGQKPPLKLKEIWAIRIRLQLAHRTRELALFNLAIDSKLRGCDLVGLRVHDIVQGSRIAPRAIVMQKKTQRSVQFEITEQTRDAVAAWIEGALAGLLLPSRVSESPHLTKKRLMQVIQLSTIGP
jgi:hypothetical protein